MGTWSELFSRTCCVLHSGWKYISQNCTISWPTERAISENLSKSTLNKSLPLSTECQWELLPDMVWAEFWDWFIFGWCLTEPVWGLGWRAGGGALGRRFSGRGMLSQWRHWWENGWGERQFLHYHGWGKLISVAELSLSSLRTLCCLPVSLLLSLTPCSHDPALPKRLSNDTIPSLNSRLWLSCEGELCSCPCPLLAAWGWWWLQKVLPNSPFAAVSWLHKTLGQAQV